MRFFKENSYDIVRFYIFQIGITIFSLLLYTAVGVLEDAAAQTLVKLLISVLSVVFYLALLYTVSWEYGAKDRIRIDGGKFEGDKFKGAKLSLYANIPNFVLTVLSLIFLLLYMANAGEGWNTAYAILTMILRLFASMYIGILQAVFASFSESVILYSLLQTIGYLVLPILAILASHIGYSFGDKSIRIFGFISGKKNKK